MEGGLLLHTVISQDALLIQLLAGKHQALLVSGKACKITWRTSIWCAFGDNKRQHGRPTEGHDEAQEVQRRVGRRSVTGLADIPSQNNYCGLLPTPAFTLQR